MDPELQRALARVLDEMVKAAEAIGVQGVRLWPQLVGITFIKNIAWSVFIPIAWIVTGVIVYRVFKSLREFDTTLKPNDENKGFPTFVAIGTVVCWMVIIFATFGTFAYHISGVFFPEAATVLDLLARAGAAVKK